ncbi:HlyD family secretion protein [Gilvimarinus sp. SDUM040013]|uniref:HlyD family secretion protein n=1 Tax=Gilvimarinus gilvus TaxID=3058038 RepID=A0ABU4S1R4_9GAMM|nr:HlyD family secretion protein [Gilvimarinus sp. SDUM040013]MDO3384785.1 HlyD family secretion protein [Gilvimarinus sp. SDUM040013]MDX6850397.1 HlyD family secretion protein [Gilvimarinus sp. SDUM040013]
MSEQTLSDEKPAATPAGKSVSRGGLVIFVVVIVTLLWSLLADRFTPYTSQARVQGYVVGVAPKVAGVVTDVWVGNNEYVKAGQKLFGIDQSQYQIALQQAESNLRNTEKQVEAGDAGVTKARASLRAAKAGRLKAEQDYSRLKRLRQDDPGTVSERRLEMSEASLEQARAQVAVAEAEIQRAIEQKGGDTGEENTLLQTAQSAVEKANLDLSNTTVVAQSDGVVTDLRAEVGQFAGTGSPVLTLVAMESIWITADYTENNLGHLKPGTAVEILLDSLPGQVLKGTVRSIGVGVSSGQSVPAGALPSVQNNRDWLRQAQRFPVQIALSEPVRAEVKSQLRIGGQASVIAYTEGHGLLALIGKLYIRLLSLLTYAY